MNATDAMTREQWFAEGNPDRLLAFVNPPIQLPPGPWPPFLGIPQPRLRRLTLFGCACGRMVWDLLPTNLCNAIEIRERYVEGRASDVDVRASAVREFVGAVTMKQHLFLAATADQSTAARAAAKALAARAAGPPPPGHPVSRKWQARWNRVYHDARATQAAILRDVFPPPDYAPRLEREWLTSTVTAIARQMDETGDFAATPILADALQDAGCTDETVLQCCRAAGNVHVRGNWVVDLVLGRV